LPAHEPHASACRLHAIVRLAPLKATVQERKDVGEHQIGTHESFGVCEVWKDLELRARNLVCRRLRLGENEVPLTSVKKARRCNPREPLDERRSILRGCG